jgi:aminodeoxyfutalosine synthase
MLVRRRLHGQDAFYNVNTHINPSNICVNHCRFCAFRADAGDQRAYAMTIDEVLDRARQAGARGITELHIVGSSHPDKPLDYYLELLSRLHAALPHVHLKAYTAVEIAHFAELSGLGTREVLERLIDAGLGSLPGGGAEIFHPDVRERICPTKIDGRTWLAIHAEAHELGLKSNATMLYGHVEDAEHRIDHLVRLREQQHATGGFQAFIPLPYLPKGTDLTDGEATTGLADLKTVAVNRLMLDNIPHIKAYWVMLGVKVAQVALAFGADDLDGTVVQEQIGHQAGSESPQEMTVEQIRRLIRETGHEPVERDTLYRRVERGEQGERRTFNVQR